MKNSVFGAITVFGVLFAGTWVSYVLLGLLSVAVLTWCADILSKRILQFLATKKVA